MLLISVLLSAFPAQAEPTDKELIGAFDEAMAPLFQSPPDPGFSGVSVQIGALRPSVDRFACPYRSTEVQSMWDGVSDTVASCFQKAGRYAAQLVLKDQKVTVTMPAQEGLGDESRTCVVDALESMEPGGPHMATTVELQMVVEESAPMAGEGSLLIGGGGAATPSTATVELVLRDHALAPRTDDMLPARRFDDDAFEEDFAESAAKAAASCMGQTTSETVVFQVGLDGVQARACGEDEARNTCLTKALAGSWSYAADPVWALGVVRRPAASSGGGGGAGLGGGDDF